MRPSVHGVTVALGQCFEKTDFVRMWDHISTFIDFVFYVRGLQVVQLLLAGMTIVTALRPFSKTTPFTYVWLQFIFWATLAGNHHLLGIGAIMSIA